MMNVPPIERTIKKGRYVAGEDGKMHLETKRVQDGNWLRTKVCYDYSNVTTLFDPITFARVLTHEIDHNLGMRHNSMARVGDLDCGYAEPFIVEPHRPAQKPRINRAEINRLRAEANLKRALMRFKRAQTILKKWQRKVSYYQSQALKSQQATPAPTLGGNGGGGEL